MKQVLKNAVKLATLAGTGWLLIATSPLPPVCDSAGPVRYQVATTCGPAGVITVYNDKSCEIQVEGAAAVNLPEQGSLVNLSGSIVTADWLLYRSEAGGDGGTGADGGMSEARYRECQVTRGAQAGVLSVECKENSMVVCSGTLTEQP